MAERNLGRPWTDGEGGNKLASTSCFVLADSDLALKMHCLLPLLKFTENKTIGKLLLSQFPEEQIRLAGRYYENDLIPAAGVDNSTLSAGCIPCHLL